MAASLAACTGGVTSTDTTSSVTDSDFKVSGSITGLSGSGLVLQNSDGDALTIAANGSFTFATPLIRGESYSISVASQPNNPSQSCAVANGNGVVGDGNVSGITVTCVDKTSITDTIGGTATGVLGTGLVLQDNGGDNLAVAANGAFTFATPLQSGLPYAVSILSPPIDPYQDCVIANGTGTTGSSNVTNVSVSCKTNVNPTYPIGGTISGIVAGSITLEDNGRDNLTVSSNGPFTFKIPIPSGSSYSVIQQQVSGPQSETCTFANASGTVGTSAVTNVAITCLPNVPVSLTVSGLVGSGLVLEDNGGDNLAITGDGTATFPTALASGAHYAITVQQQPTLPTQSCAVSNATGTAVAGSTTHIAVVCTTLSFAVDATVSGLVGTGLVLQGAGGKLFPVAANGTLVIAPSIASGSAYAVTVATQPSTPAQTCTPASVSGTIGAANVVVAITCTTNTYTVGGVVTGLVGSGLILQDNGGNNLPVPQDGVFTFMTPLPSGSTYLVTVSTQPSSPYQTCLVSSGSGPVTTTAITNVTVACSTNTISVAVSGLNDPHAGNPNAATPAGLILQVNGGDNLPIAGDTSSATFAGTFPFNSAYDVTVFNNPATTTNPDDIRANDPPGFACTVSNGSGTIAGPVTNISVSCSQIGGYLYVSNYAGDTLSGFAIDFNTGGLQPLTGVVAATGQQNAVVINPIQSPASTISGCQTSTTDSGGNAFNTLYVSAGFIGSPTLSAYTVDTSPYLNTSGLPNGGTLALIGAAPAYPEVTAFQYTTLDFASEIAEQAPSCDLFALTGVPLSGVNYDLPYVENQTSGALTPVTPGDRALAVGNPDEVQIVGASNTDGIEYVATQSPSLVWVYSINSAGGLDITLRNFIEGQLISAVEIASPPSAITTTDLFVSPCGTDACEDVLVPIIYVASQSSGNIAVYQGDVAGGTFAPSVVQTVSDTNGPTAMFCPGQLLFVTNVGGGTGGNGSVQVYSIDQSLSDGTTGALAPPRTYPVGANPVAVTVQNIGSATYVYIVNNGSNNITVYQLTDPTTGTLTPVGTYAAGTSPTSISVPYAIQDFNDDDFAEHGSKAVQAAARRSGSH